MNKIKQIIYKESTIDTITKYLDKTTLEKLICQTLLESFRINETYFVAHNIAFPTVLRVGLVYLKVISDKYIKKFENIYVSLNESNFKNTTVKNMLSEANYYLIKNDLDSFVGTLARMWFYKTNVLKVYPYDNINIMFSSDLITLLPLLFPNIEDYIEDKQILEELLNIVNKQLIKRNLSLETHLKILDKIFYNGTYLQYDDDDSYIYRRKFIECDNSLVETVEKKTIDQIIDEYLEEI